MTQPSNTVPVLAIEIDDTQFRAFQDKFAKFQEDAAKAPEAWRKTDEQIAEIRKRFDEIRATAAEQGDAAEKTEEKAQKSKDHFRTYVAGLATLAVSSRGFGGHVATATKNIATWTRHAVTLSVLFELGGAYGIGALAGAASSRRYRATGLGISTGQLASIGVNFDRLGNTDALLNGFNAAATDMRLQQPLVSLGMDPRGKNGAQLLVEALPRIKDRLDQADPSTFQSTMRAYNLGQLGFSEQTLQLMRGMKRSEIMDLVRAYGADQGSLEIPDEAGLRWRDLLDQLSRAESQIKTGLTVPLAQLTPGLTDLSSALVHLLDGMLAQPEVKAGLDSLGAGITKFADTVGSPHAVSQFDNFLNSFKLAGRDFDTLNKFLSTYGAALVTGYAAYRGYRLGGLPGAVLAAGAATWGLLPEERKQQVLERKHAWQDAEKHHFTGAVYKAEQALGLNKPSGNDALWARSRTGRRALYLAQDPLTHPPSGGPRAAGPLGGIAGDLSGLSTYARQGEHIDPAAFIVHHTGGGGTPEGVISTLNQRGLGVQFVMDRDGKIYRALPDGSRGAHIMEGDVNGLHLSNSNTIGMEVIAKDDSDVTPEEVQAGVAFYKKLQQRYPGLQVYGHGYVNPGHKQATEGKTIVDAIHAAEQLPADPMRDAKQAIRDSAKYVPPAQRGFTGSGAYAGKDPTAPAQACVVSNETGGACTVTVAH